MLIRDGAKDVSLRYLAEQPRYFSTSHLSAGICPLIFFLLFSFDTGVEQLQCLNKEKTFEIIHDIYKFGFKDGEN